MNRPEWANRLSFSTQKRSKIEPIECIVVDDPRYAWSITDRFQWGIIEAIYSGKRAKKPYLIVNSPLEPVKMPDHFRPEVSILVAYGNDHYRYEQWLRHFRKIILPPDLFEPLSQQDAGRELGMAKDPIRWHRERAGIPHRSPHIKSVLFDRHVVEVMRIVMFEQFESQGDPLAKLGE